MASPFLLVVAGPNGSGKTTLTTFLRRSGIDFGDYINPDDIAATLQGSYDARVQEAQKTADAKRAACIAGRRSFSFETVMSHPSKIEIMREARDAGFEVTLFFVATINPDINVARVGQRVALGGHDVSDDKIKARYVRTLSLLPDAIRAAHTSFLFDNSASGPDAERLLSLLLEIKNGVDGIKIVGNRAPLAKQAALTQWVATALRELGL